MPLGTSTLDVILTCATLATAVGTLALAAATFLLSRQNAAVVRATRATAEAANREVEAASAQLDMSQRQVTAMQKQVEASQRQGAAAEAALSAQVRPALIDVPSADVWDDAPAGNEKVRKGDIVCWARSENGRGRCSVPLRNGGSGLAMIRGALIRLVNRDGREAEGPPVEWAVSRQNLAPRDETRLTFEIDQRHPLWEAFLFTFTEYGSPTVEIHYTDVSGEQ